MRSWSPTIDPKTIPDAVLASEAARRRGAKRATFAGPPKVLRACQRCGAKLGARELRRHICAG